MRTLSTVILDIFDSRWLDIISANQQANIFHHPAWLNLIANSYGYRSFIMAIKDSYGKITAGIPIMEVGSWLTGHRLVSLPFTDHCAPLYLDNESLSYLVKSLVDYSHKKQIPNFQIRWEFVLASPFHSYSNFVLHTVPLEADSSLVASRFHPSHRRNINVSVKKGVSVHLDTSLDYIRKFYNLHLITRRRQGVPVQPWKFFEMLGKDIIEKGLGYVLLAKKSDEYIAGAIFLQWNKTITYKYGASLPSELQARPNNLIFSHAIHLGCKNGYITLDMGRTDYANEGLRTFKSNWGAKESPLVYSSLSEISSGRKMEVLNLIMQTVIRNSPPWVCSAIGNSIYRHFG